MVYHGAKSYGHDSHSIHKDNIVNSTLEHQNSSMNLGLIRGPQDACLYTTGIQFVSIHSHPQSSFDQVIHLIASQHPRQGTCLCRMKGLGGHVQSSGGPAPPETSALPGDWLTDSFGRSFSHFLCERDLKNEKLMRGIKWRSSLYNVFDVDSKENKHANVFLFSPIWPNFLDVYSCYHPLQAIAWDCSGRSSTKPYLNKTYQII